MLREGWSMSGHRTIEAVFEDGVFRPLVEVKLPEHQRVSIVVTVQRPARRTARPRGGRWGQLRIPCRSCGRPLLPRRRGACLTRPLLRGDVILVPFPFTDLTAVKLRPAVILTPEPTGPDLVAAYLSSVIPEEPLPTTFASRRAEFPSQISLRPVRTRAREASAAP